MTKITLNNHRTERWKADVAESVEFYNNWFLHFAPQTYITERNEAARVVEEALKRTNDLTAINTEVLIPVNGLERYFGKSLMWVA